MHDPWFFIDSPLAVPSDGSPRPPIVLSGGDAHHLTVVRRARAGDRVCVSDGAGTIVEGRTVGDGPLTRDAPCGGKASRASSVARAGGPRR